MALFTTPFPTAAATPQGPIQFEKLPLLDQKIKVMEKNWTYTIENAAFNGEYFELEVRIENPVVKYSSVQKFSGGSSEEFSYRILRQIKALNDFYNLYGVRGKVFKANFKNLDLARRRNSLIEVEAPPPLLRRRKKNLRRKKK